MRCREEMCGKSPGRRRPSANPLAAPPYRFTLARATHWRVRTMPDAVRFAPATSLICPGGAGAVIDIDALTEPQFAGIGSRVRMVTANRDNAKAIMRRCRGRIRDHPVETGCGGANPRRKVRPGWRRPQRVSNRFRSGCDQRREIQPNGVDAASKRLSLRGASRGDCLSAHDAGGDRRHVAAAGDSRADGLGGVSAGAQRLRFQHSHGRPTVAHPTVCRDSALHVRVGTGMEFNDLDEVLSEESDAGTSLSAAAHADRHVFERRSSRADHGGSATRSHRDDRPQRAHVFRSG